MKHTSLHSLAGQLAGFRCFFEYVRITGRLFWACPGFLSAYGERYVIFPRSSRKGPGGSCRKPACGTGFPGICGTGFCGLWCTGVPGTTGILRMRERMGVRFRQLV